MGFRYDKGADIDYTDSAANSPNFPEGTSWIWCWSTTDCYVVVGDTVTATATGIPLFAYERAWLPVPNPVKDTNRVSAIRVATSGSLFYIPWTD